MFSGTYFPRTYFGDYFGTAESVPVAYCRNPDLTICFREHIAPELSAASESSACMNYEAWKRLYYHWKYNRNIGMINDIALENDPELYFIEPETSIISDNC